MPRLSFLSLAVLLAACGGASTTNLPGGDLPCGAQSCGKAAFRAVLPTFSRLSIQLQRPSSTQQGLSGLSQKKQGLEAASPAHAALAKYAEDVNATFDGLLGEVDALAQTQPEEETDARHVWSRALSSPSGWEETLTLATEDGRTFSVELAAGPKESPSVALSGTVVGKDGALEDVDLQLNLGVALGDGGGATGTLRLRARPFAGTGREVWYDFQDVQLNGGEVQSSLTTFWDFPDGSGALEYLLAGDQGSEATVYARFSEKGGRVDSQGAANDATLGRVERVTTQCWSAQRAETFVASATVDEAGGYHGALEGNEADCAYRALDGAPVEREAFAKLPADGEWDDLIQP